MGVSALDNLAANGIIDFDADSYIKGEPARYVGNPRGYVGLPLDRPILAEPRAYGVVPGAMLSGQPNDDAFVHKGEGGHEEKHGEHSNISWKKALTGSVFLGLAVFGGIKYRTQLVNFAKKIINKKQAPAAATAAKEAAQTQPAATTAKKSKIPKWLKVTGLSLAGVLGLYGVYSAVSSRAPQEHAHH